MKIKVPIERKEHGFNHETSSTYSSYAGGFNECLDEVSQCECVFNVDVLAKLIFKLECPHEKWDNKGFLIKTPYQEQAKKIISKMPSIMTIKRNENAAL